MKINSFSLSLRKDVISLTKLLTLLGMATMSIQIFAQTSKIDQDAHSKLCQSYNRVGLAYTNTDLSYKYNPHVSDREHFSLNGIAMEYIHGFSLSKKIPLFIETGAKINFGFGMKSESGPANYPGFSIKAKLKEKIQNIYFSIPVNVAYKIGINEKVSCTPYAGVNFKWNILSREKILGEAPVTIQTPYISITVDDDFDSGWSYLTRGNHKVSPCQIGWQAGATLNLNHAYVGLNYGTDFTHFVNDDVNSSNFTLSLGYLF